MCAAGRRLRGPQQQAAGDTQAEFDRERADEAFRRNAIHANADEPPEAIGEQGRRAQRQACACEIPIEDAERGHDAGEQNERPRRADLAHHRGRRVEGDAIEAEEHLGGKQHQAADGEKRQGGKAENQPCHERVHSSSPWSFDGRRLVEIGWMIYDQNFRKICKSSNVSDAGWSRRGNRRSRKPRGGDRPPRPARRSAASPAPVRHVLLQPGTDRTLGARGAGNARPDDADRHDGRQLPSGACGQRSADPSPRAAGAVAERKARQPQERSGRRSAAIVRHSRDTAHALLRNHGSRRRRRDNAHDGRGFAGRSPGRPTFDRDPAGNPGPGCRGRGPQQLAGGHIGAVARGSPISQAGRGNDPDPPDRRSGGPGHPGLAGRRRRGRDGVARGLARSAARKGAGGGSCRSRRSVERGPPCAGGGNVEVRLFRALRQAAGRDADDLRAVVADPVRQRSPQGDPAPDRGDRAGIRL